MARPNRFVVQALLEPNASGPEPVDTHLPDPGRLRELLIPGRRIWLRPAGPGPRRTRWTTVLVESPDGDGLVSLDTTLPNRLVARALRSQALEELSGWSLERSEWTWKGSRFDFLLSGEGGRRLVLEVKSVTLAEEGVALFPDAVTARGTRHLQELSALAEDGAEAAVLFVVQREGCRRMIAAESIDPAFTRALREARAAGVRVLARCSTPTLREVRLGGPIPVA